jgi:tetratricopeptide (TPR) repeat protein
MTPRLRISPGWVAAGLALVAGVAAAAPYVVLPSGQKVEGVKLRTDKDGSLLLTTAEGQMTFPRGTKAFVDEPPEYARALQAIQQKRPDEALPLLETLAADYRYLEWGLKAQRVLAGVWLAKGNAREAVKQYDRLFADNPDAKKDEEAFAGYLKALGEAGESEKLMALVAPTIATGPRRAAALAQLLRGNQRLAAGDIEGALLDFLRTAELFQDVPETQAEAHFRSAECFAKLGDARALEFYVKVAREFPDSPFAARAREAGSAAPAAPK